MGTLRHPAVAGAFYPEDQKELVAAVNKYPEQAVTQELIPKAVIAPHAGYLASGPVAGSAFAAVNTVAKRIERVVLLGPSHWVSFNGLAASRADAFETPLGNIPVDGDAIAVVEEAGQVFELDEAHSQEHSLEVELPFLQVMLGEFSLVPIVVGEASYEEVSKVLDALWGGEETLIVISSDLSHYLPSELARATDDQTRIAIEAMKPEDIAPRQACGRIPIGGLLLSAKKRGLKVTTLDMRNSGDTIGRKSQVVGYGAYAVG